MKFFGRHFLAALGLALALFPASAFSASMPVERRVGRLDALVGLSADQRNQAAAIFRTENTILDSFTNDQDRAIKGADARMSSKAGIRALLTPAQRKKYDVSLQSDGGGLAVNPEFLVDRLSQVVALNAGQKTKATQIIWNDLLDQMAALPEDQFLKGFTWRQPVKDQLRAILTPEQQAKFDVTPPYRASGTGHDKSSG